MIFSDVNFCTKTGSIWQLVGIIYMIIKIVIPILIIVLGIVDLAKAVVSGDEKVIKERSVGLAKRVIAGIFIFFIPVLIDATFKLLGLFSIYEGDYQNCLDCIEHPYTECNIDSAGIFPD